MHIQGHRQKLIYSVLIILILTASLFLRLYNVGRPLATTSTFMQYTNKGLSDDYDETMWGGYTILSMISDKYYTYKSLKISRKILPNLSHPPLFFYLTFIIVSTLGYSIFALRLAPVILGVGSVFLGYKLGSFYNRKTGVLSALLICFSPMLVYLNSTILIENLSTFLIMLLSLYLLKFCSFKCTNRNYLRGSVLLLCLGLLTKLHFVLFFPAIFFFFFFALKRDKKLSRRTIKNAAFILILSAVLFSIVLFLRPRMHPLIDNLISSPKKAILHSSLLNIDLQSRYLHDLINLMGLPLIILSFLGIMAALKKCDDTDKYLLSLTISLIIILHAFSIQHTRYIAMITPFLLILASRFIIQIHSIIKENTMGKITFGVFISILFIYNIFILGVMLNQIKTGGQTIETELEKICRARDQLIENNDMIITNTPQTEFYLTHYLGDGEFTPEKKVNALYTSWLENDFVRKRKPKFALLNEICIMDESQTLKRRNILEICQDIKHNYRDIWHITYNDKSLIPKYINSYHNLKLEMEPPITIWTLYQLK